MKYADIWSPPSDARDAVMKARWRQPDEYNTSLFDLMQKNHRCTRLSTLLNRVPRERMSEICKKELDCIASFYSGTLVITADEKGEFHIDGMLDGEEHHGYTSDLCSKYTTILSNGSVYTESCYIEHRGMYVSLLGLTTHAIIWPREFTPRRKRQSSK